MEAAILDLWEISVFPPIGFQRIFNMFFICWFWTAFKSKKKQFWLLKLCSPHYIFVHF